MMQLFLIGLAIAGQVYSSSLPINDLQVLREIKPIDRARQDYVPNNDLEILNPDLNAWRKTSPDDPLLDVDKMLKAPCLFITQEGVFINDADTGKFLGLSWKQMDVARALTKYGDMVVTPDMTPIHKELSK